MVYINSFKILFLLLLSSSLLSDSYIDPIPLDVDYNKKKAELGKKLFFDPILSGDSTIACVSCHTLPGSGADNRAFSIGINGTEGILNSPTVLNSAFNFTQFWNGRAKSLHEQSLGPITNPIEMNSSIKDLLERLKKSSYRGDFEKLFKEGVNQDNFLDAIAEFEKALFTPNSRFDKYLRGDSNAITEQERRGYKTFKNIGCVSCHNGINIGGNMFQKMGILIPYKQAKASNGRYEVTKRERDRYVFKVPSLRNVALSAPYFHDGRALTLKDAISMMAEHQLGIIPEDTSLADIEAFLKTLTGDVPTILKESK